MAYQMMTALGSAITELEEDPSLKVVTKPLTGRVGWAGEDVALISVKVEISDEAVPAYTYLLDEDVSLTSCIAEWRAEVQRTRLQQFVDYHKEQIKIEKKLVRMEEDIGGQRAAHIRKGVHEAALEWLERIL